jgi:serine/threonine protein kinase
MQPVCVTSRSEARQANAVSSADYPAPFDAARTLTQVVPAAVPGVVRDERASTKWDDDTADVVSSCPSSVRIDAPSCRSGVLKERTPAFLVGSKIGKYEIRHILGQGGQARAYLAFDPDLERHVVLKVYHDASADGVDEVLKEGRALARVSSPNVAQCFGAEHFEGMPYLVLEYVPGRTLVELQAAGGLKLRRAIELVAQVVDGLAAVHACGMLHRDLKPSNIIVGDDGVPRLVDFGLAEPVSGLRSASVSGTLAYMPPEQARGETDRVGPASDLFGIGAVLYELLSGRPPYVAEHQDELLDLARAGVVTPVDVVRSGLPGSVLDLCRRCLATEPEDRYGSAVELRSALRVCLKRRRRRKGVAFGFRLGKRRFSFQFSTSLSLFLVVGLLASSQILHTPEEIHLQPSSPSPSATTALSDAGILSDARGPVRSLDDRFSYSTDAAKHGVAMRSVPMRSLAVSDGVVGGDPIAQSPIAQSVLSRTGGIAKKGRGEIILTGFDLPLRPHTRKPTRHVVSSDDILLRLTPESKARVQSLLERVYHEIECGLEEVGTWRAARSRPETED